MLDNVERRQNDLRSYSESMSLLQAYLQSSKTRQILSRKPGEKGFSLIELVVVIAVLAVLTVVALPGFLGVTDDAAVRSAQSSLVSYLKECTILNAKRDYSSTPVVPELSGFSMGATAAAASAAGLALTATPADCFSATNAFQNVAAIPTTPNQFPVFFINSSTGAKTCTSGNPLFAKTYMLGCNTNGVASPNSPGTWE